MIFTSGEPQNCVHVKLRQAEARARGFSSEHVATALTTLFSGAPVTAWRDGNRLLDVVVRAKADERNDLTTLANLQLTSPLGKSVPLTQIATLAYGVEEPIVWRRQRQPIVTVQADIVDHIQPATVSEQLKGAVARFKAQLPPGYDVQEGGRSGRLPWRE